MDNTEEIVKFRGTLILLIIAALLAGYILFVESKEPSEEDQGEISENVVDSEEETNP